MPYKSINDRWEEFASGLQPECSGEEREVLHRVFLFGVMAVASALRDVCARVPASTPISHPHFMRIFLDMAQENEALNREAAESLAKAAAQEQPR